MSSASPLAGNRLLVVTSQAPAGRTIAAILAELYQADVTVKDPRDYDVWIDEYCYDGLIYYGADYYKPPGTNFIADVTRTRKPVLWLGYHGWLLDPEYLAAKGLLIRDRHTPSMISVSWDPPVAIQPREVTDVEASDDAVLFWLADTKGERRPGAVHAQNLTYVPYVPGVDVYTTEFAPVLAAIRSAFGTALPPRRPAAAHYDARVQAARQDRFRTGVHLPVYVARTSGHEPGYESDRWHANLIRIREAGAEWVNLVRTYQMANVNASVVEASPSLTPAFDSLANIIDDAHKVGLLVRLHIAINLEDRRPNEWHGMIAPADRARWWASFGALVRELGDFARQHDVESLMLGTEFTSMQGDSGQWHQLIRVLRDEVRYRGLIGYGVNFNSLNIDWLDALDFFGISAYWPLSDDRDPDLTAMMRAWESIDTTLRRWKAAHTRVPLELGEVGYVSQPYASVLPFSWKAHKGDQQSLSEQLRCYESLRQFLATAPYISGVHFFASTAEDDDPGSRGYTPFGKPAERVMKAILKMR